LVAARHLTLLHIQHGMTAGESASERACGVLWFSYRWHPAGALPLPLPFAPRGGDAFGNWDWVGGSSKGLADSNGESSKKLADSNGELALIKSKDRPFEKAQRFGYTESRKLRHPPRPASVKYAKILGTVSPLITILLAGCFGVYGVALLLEALKRRLTPFALLEVVGLVAAFLVLRWTTGFPSPREAFSAGTPIFAIVVLLLCTALGTAASYYFYLEGEFALRAFLKPMVVSPLVVLPLLGFVATGSGIEPHQLIYLGFVAFQNGFFWKTVYEREKRRSR
jgi:hypothetical protein